MKKTITLLIIFIMMSVSGSAFADHIIKVLKTEDVHIEYERKELRQTDINKYTDSVTISVLCIDGYKFIYQGQILRQMFRELGGESVPMKCEE